MILGRSSALELGDLRVDFVHPLLDVFQFVLKVDALLFQIRQRNGFDANAFSLR